ncbi:MAG: SpoIIIAH-like family protein [Clostridia bacterium]|nr:SpoIIIAH-like family protein [Clostridia bacterium]
MTFGKRQLLVGALVVALGAAVYLNWQFSGTKPVEVTDTPETSSSKQLGQTVYVNTEVSGETAAKSQTSDADKKAKDDANSKEAIETAALNADTDTNDYFSSERRKRTQAYDEAVRSLQDIAASEDKSSTARQEAVQALEKLSAAIKAESGIEAEVRTKGFKDCIALINNDTCTVIVPSASLNDATAITIKDIVNRQSGIGFDKITVTPYNG